MTLLNKLIRSRLVWMLLGALLAISVLLVGQSITRESGSIESRISSCFKASTTGLKYGKFKSTITLRKSADQRSQASPEQIRCALERLGFDPFIQERMDWMTSESRDNEDFRVTWNFPRLPEKCSSETDSEPLQAGELPTFPLNCSLDQGVLKITFQDFR